jgi:uncharacterized membrane protein YkoI
LIACALLAVSLAVGAIGTAGALHTDKLSSASDNGLDGQDAQEPAYTSSVVIQDSTMTENQEAQALQQYATISQQTAVNVALNEIPGTPVKVVLENENGNVVYSVEILTSSGNMDVKVDAGNGQVLGIDTNNED